MSGRTPRSFFRALVLTAALCTALCASAQTEVWLDVPYVVQQKDGCGAAVISMVMQYWERQQGLAETPNAQPENILHAL